MTESVKTTPAALQPHTDKAAHNFNGTVQKLGMDAPGKLQTFHIFQGDDCNLSLDFNYSVDYYDPVTRPPSRVVLLNTTPTEETPEVGGRMITQVHVWKAAELSGLDKPIRFEIRSHRGRRYPVEIVIDPKRVP